MGKTALGLRRANPKAKPEQPQSRAAQRPALHRLWTGLAPALPRMIATGTAAPFPQLCPATSSRIPFPLARGTGKHSGRVPPAIVPSPHRRRTTSVAGLPTATCTEFGVPTS